MDDTYQYNAEKREIKQIEMELEYNSTLLNTLIQRFIELSTLPYLFLVPLSQLNKESALGFFFQCVVDAITAYKCYAMELNEENNVNVNTTFFSPLFFDSVIEFSVNSIHIFIGISINFRHQN